MVSCRHQHHELLVNSTYSSLQQVIELVNYWLSKMYSLYFSLQAPKVWRLIADICIQSAIIISIYYYIIMQMQLIGRTARAATYATEMWRCCCR